jgi:hypothetical protein
LKSGIRPTDRPTARKRASYISDPEIVEAALLHHFATFAVFARDTY